MAAAINVETKAIMSEIRIDSMRRESTSRPSSSEPRMCRHVPPMKTGGCSRPLKSRALKS